MKSKPSYQKLIYQGAEAKIILYEDTNLVLKERIPKNYRIKELDDKIRKSRTKKEIKLLKKASKIIFVPKLKEDVKISEFQIVMDFIEGEKLSEFLNKYSLEKQKEIAKIIGEQIAKLHDNSIIHADLTTSNMILYKNLTKPLDPKSKDQIKIYFIDFGLGFISEKLEDKAVDLHLLKQALEAKHYKNFKELWTQIKKGYSKSKNSKKVFERLNAVEKRGRYKK